MEPKQVKLSISTDLYHTADFLRQLANEIENYGEETFDDFENAIGVAEIDWPE